MSLYNFDPDVFVIENEIRLMRSAKFSYKSLIKYLKLKPQIRSCPIFGYTVLCNRPPSKLFWAAWLAFINWSGLYPCVADVLEQDAQVSKEPQGLLMLEGLQFE